MSGPAREPLRGLARRVLLGTAYVGVGNWTTYVFNFAIQIAIARLLGPTELGLYAFVFAVAELLGILGAFSLDLAVIQARRESQKLYDTALALSAGLGVAVLLAAAALAPVLWWQRSGLAAGFLGALALARVLLLLSRVPNARLERSFRYATVSWIAFVGTTLPNLGALGLAWQGWGAASLVLRDLCGALLIALLAASRSGYRFRRQVSREAARQLMRFSRPMFASRSLEILLQRVDRLALGVLVGDTATGLYHQARFLGEAGLLATRPISQLSFNLFARLQDDRVRLRRAYQLVNYFLARVVFAGAAALLVFPEEIVRLLLGAAWAPAAPVLRVLGVYAGLLPVFENAKQLLYGLGQVGRNVRIRAIQLALFAPGVVVAGLGGSVSGAALVLLAVTALGLVLAWRATGELLGGAPWRLVLVPALVLAATVVGMEGLASAGALEAIPWWARPLLPPLVYALALLVLEGRRLAAELAYLRRQAAGPAEPSPAPGADGLDRTP